MIMKKEGGCYGLNASMPPKLMRWKPIGTGDGIRRWFGHEARALINGTNALIKRSFRELSHPFHHVRMPKKFATRRGSSSDHAGSHVLHVQTDPATVRHRVLQPKLRQCMNNIVTILTLRAKQDFSEYVTKPNGFHGRNIRPLKVLTKFPELVGGSYRKGSRNVGY